MDEPVDISVLQERVREHREKLGLSLRAAAADCDVPFNTLARVEKGYLPDLANFRRIVTWLGLAPEQFFQPPRLRTENTPEIIAHHLRRDPNLTDTAAGQIAALVHELYSNLARPPRPVQIRLRAARVFKPEASQLLGDILEAMQDKLLAHPEPDQDRG
jgi:transcriptional regulator with XRE-family HTH domain